MPPVLIPGNMGIARGIAGYRPWVPPLAWKAGRKQQEKGGADSQWCKGKGAKAISCHCKSQSLFCSTDEGSCEQHSA